MSYFFDVGSDDDDDEDFEEQQPQVVEQHEEEEAPTQKKSRVGPEYQAVVPPWTGRTNKSRYSTCTGTCVWQARSRKKSKAVERFVRAKSRVEPGGYCVKVHLYWMIHQWDYDIKHLEQNWERVTRVCPLPVVAPLTWKEKSLLYVCSVWVPHNWTLLAASIPERSLEELKTFWWKDIYLMQRTDGDPVVNTLDVHSMQELEQKRQKRQKRREQPEHAPPARHYLPESPLDSMKRKIARHNEQFY